MNKFLDIMLGVAFVTAALSLYTLTDNGLFLQAAAIMLSGTYIGVYLAQYIAKSERTQFGDKQHD